MCQEALNPIIISKVGRKKIKIGQIMAGQIAFYINSFEIWPVIVSKSYILWRSLLMILRSAIGANGVTSGGMFWGYFLFRLRGFLGNFAFCRLIFNWPWHRFVRKTTTFLNEENHVIDFQTPFFSLFVIIKTSAAQCMKTRRCTSFSGYIIAVQKTGEVKVIA